MSGGGGTALPQSSIIRLAARGPQGPQTKVQARTRPPQGVRRAAVAYGAGMVHRILRRGGDEGQTTVEYATVVALVAIVIALALAVMPGDLFTAFWSTVQSAL